MAFIKLRNLYLDITGAAFDSKKNSVTLYYHGGRHEFTAPEYVEPLKHYFATNPAFVDVINLYQNRNDPGKAVGFQTNQGNPVFIPETPTGVVFIPENPPGLPIAPPPRLPKPDLTKIRTAITRRGKGPVDLLPHEVKGKDDID